MNWLPHTTVATLVVKDNRFLMVEEQSDHGFNVLNQPAGHLDANETLFEAALRETLEETAWEVTLTGFLGTCLYKARNGVTYIRHSFLARPVQEHQLELDEGILRTHWLSDSEIRNHKIPARSPMVVKVLDDYKSGRILPLDTLSHLAPYSEL